MAKQTNYNAGIYVRLSQEDERAGESLSIENQKMILTEYVEKQGWNLVSTYVDDGYSGTDFERPGVKQLIEDAQLGKINLIIVKDLSRFGRNYIEVGRYIDYIFPAHNIRFIALSDNIDTIDRNSTAMEMMPIINMFNEWHAASTSKKLRVVKEANAKAGKYRAAIAPYGYVPADDDKRLPIPDEPAASVVRRIFEEKAAGKSNQEIADGLNADEIPIPSDYYYGKLGKENPYKTTHLWCGQLIRKIIFNPIYTGDLVQMRSTTVSYKNHTVVNKDSSEWVVIENTHEPLVSREMWDKIHENDQAARRGKRTSEGITLPLSGLMFCADCGEKMRAVYTTDNNGVRRYAYQCGGFSRFGTKYCKSHYVSETIIDDVIVADIRAKAKLVAEDENGARKAFLAEKEKRCARQTKDEQKRLKKAKSRVKELDKLIPKIYEDKVIGKIPEDVCVELLEKYQAEKRELAAEIEKIEMKANAAEQDEKDVDMLIKRLKKYTDVQEIDREMCLELIEYATVSAYDKNDKDAPREINIFYKLLHKPPESEKRLDSAKMNEAFKKAV